MTIIFSVMLLIAAVVFLTMSIPHPSHFNGCKTIGDYFRRYWDRMSPDQELAAIVSMCVIIFAVILIALAIFA